MEQKYSTNCCDYESAEKTGVITHMPLYDDPSRFNKYSRGILKRDDKTLFCVREDFDYYKTFKRVIIMGRGGSGKDYLKGFFTVKKEVSFTTRAPRVGEIDGESYHFVDTSTFEEMIKQNKFKEYAEFNGWYYGTSNDTWNSARVFIMTPSGWKQLSAVDKRESCVLYLDIDRLVCKKRLENRIGSADSVERRIKADDADFAGFRDHDLRIIDPEFNATYVAEFVEKHILET